MKKNLIHQFDYLINDNFKDFADGNPFSESDNLEIMELIDLIDPIIGLTINSNSKDTAKNFHTGADKYIQRLKSILNERSKDNVELNEVLMTIIKVAVLKVEAYLEYTILNNDYRNKLTGHNELINEKVNTLKRDGYVEFQIVKTDQFEEWSNNQLVSARKKYENESDWRGANSYPENSNEFKIIQQFIKDQNILEIISEYKQMNMRMLYAAWDYAHNRQKWFRNNHQYNRISATNYYHLDADVDVAKMLIYLTDVKEDDGPFKFVRGSNTMPRSIFLTYIYSAIDTEISPRYAQKSNLYGRGLFLYRKDLLMKFPNCFMGTTHFGDDLIDNSSLSNHLIDNTVTFTRSKGTAVLFDGFSGIHAGGNADKGERLAVQVAFRRKKSMDAELSMIQKVKKNIKEFIS